jgi:hypothetical protein
MLEEVKAGPLFTPHILVLHDGDHSVGVHGLSSEELKLIEAPKEIQQHVSDVGIKRRCGSFAQRELSR